jgi:DNA-binding transcriptional MerR regulator
MQDLINSRYCDSVIKIKCENMFLKADNLSIVMEQKKLVSFTNELHFLGQNFSRYLKQSLNAYVEINQISQKLDDKKTSEEKIEKTKNICMNHVNLLDEQLVLITNNINTLLSDSAFDQLKVRGKFLEERFSQSLDSTSNDVLGHRENIVDIRPKNKM